MKLKVKNEGRENIFETEKSDLIEWLKEKGWKDLHSINPNGNLFMGFDNSIESVIDDIEKSERLGILIGSALVNNLGHGLSIIVDNRLKMFDIGNITIDDLEVIN